MGVETVHLSYCLVSELILEKYLGQQAAPRKSSQMVAVVVGAVVSSIGVVIVVATVSILPCHHEFPYLYHVRVTKGQALRGGVNKIGHTY